MEMKGLFQCPYSTKVFSQISGEKSVDKNIILNVF